METLTRRERHRVLVPSRVVRHGGTTSLVRLSEGNTVYWLTVQLGGGGVIGGGCTIIS